MNHLDSGNYSALIKVIHICQIKERSRKGKLMEKGKSI